IEYLDRLDSDLPGRAGRAPRPGCSGVNPADRILLKWTALFHDSGKALTQTRDKDTGIIHFLGHEKFSAHLARASLKNFALGGDFINRVCRLIENHLRPLLFNPDTAQEKSLRKMVFDLEDDLELLLLHAEADLEATRGRASGPRLDKLARLSHRLLSIYHQERTSFIKPLLTGRDLLGLGLKPGPEIGIIIKLIHKQQLNGLVNSREEALAAARALLADNPPDRGA
ncbi:MAG: HD domain-containing protein, partial [Deltaproteobacteria bacterium]|nr:HD domain-containing protein [Deltaproteobacteria bacterium]